MTGVHFLAFTVIPAKNADVRVSVFLAFSVLPVAIRYLAVVFNVTLRNTRWRAGRQRRAGRFGRFNAQFNVRISTGA